MNIRLLYILRSLVLVVPLLFGSSVAVFAQATGVAVDILGRGHVDYADPVGGPADVVIATITLAPGGRTGWHRHAGPVWAVVTQGELSIYEHDGCRLSYPTGSVRGEIPGDVHEGRNEGNEPVEMQVIYLVPAGSDLSAEAPAPTATCPP